MFPFRRRAKHPEGRMLLALPPTEDEAARKRRPPPKCCRKGAHGSKDFAWVKCVELERWQSVWPRSERRGMWTQHDYDRDDWPSKWCFVLFWKQWTLDGVRVEYGVILERRLASQRRIDSVASQIAELKRRARLIWQANR